MDNVIASLPSRVSPMALAAGASVALATGAINHASTLLEIYVSEETEDTKVKAIGRIAEAGITCEEFAKSCKKAQEMADDLDKANGFKAPDDAKGQDLYGPKRRVLNQRLSEAKRLFGVFKMQPDVLKERGYWSALDAARTYLDQIGMKWDGTKQDTSESKANKNHAKLARKALEAVMVANPMQAGESIKTYNDRMSDMVEQTMEDMQEQAQQDAVNKVVKSLTEKHPDWNFLLAVADAIYQMDEQRTIAEESEHSQGEAESEKKAA
jgi:hypothetical protein